MRIGMIGLGKLGLPVALAMDWRGHEVMGYDVKRGNMQKQQWPYAERGPSGEPSIEPLLRQSRVQFGSLAQVVAHAEIVFVAVQTPHGAAYEGVTRLPDSRADFDYTYLEQAMADLSSEIARQGANKSVAIISTVLPGTLEQRIKPLCHERVRLVYNPSFIAMGTVMRDYLDPEFVLLGVDDPHAAEQLEAFYAEITTAPVYRTSLRNAELIKVAYNTLISTKIAFANVLMELCHKVGCDVDQVTGALKLAHRRLMSGAYLDGGMGDGGGCHPRDNIALSHLAREVGLSVDWFETIMLTRERQAAWLVELMCEHELPKVILGAAFKAETNIMTGSAALLCARLLEERGEPVTIYDPLCDLTPELPTPAVFLVGTRHTAFQSFDFPLGSVVIDPWRYIPDQAGVSVVRVGGQVWNTQPTLSTTR